MFEDIVVKNEKKINEWDVSLIDLLEMKSQVIKLQEETIKNQRKDIIHYDGLLYKKNTIIAESGRRNKDITCNYQYSRWSFERSTTRNRKITLTCSVKLF